MGPSGLPGQAPGPRGHQAWPLRWDGQTPPPPWLLPGHRPAECICRGLPRNPVPPHGDLKYARVTRVDPPIYLARLALHWLAGDCRAPSLDSIPGVPLPQCASPVRVPQSAPRDAPLNPLDCIPGGGDNPEVSRGRRAAGEEHARGVRRGGPWTAAVPLTWAAPPRTGRGGRSEQPRAAATAATATTAATAASRALSCAFPPRIPVRMARARANCKGRARHVLEQVGGRWGRSPQALRVPGTSWS